MDDKTKVYIKINESKEIIDINSETFLTDLNGWIEIDEGVGNKYIRSQVEYLDKPICELTGKYNYKYINDKIECVDNK